MVLTRLKKNDKGRTAYDWAVREEHKSAIEMLKNCANQDSVSAHGPSSGPLTPDFATALVKTVLPVSRSLSRVSRCCAT